MEMVFMIFKNEKDLEIATRLTNHGKFKKFDHELVGYTDIWTPYKQLSYQSNLKEFLNVVTQKKIS